MPEIYPSEEKYNCLKSLNRFVRRFESLQCDIGACSGDIHNKKILIIYANHVENIL